MHVNPVQPWWPRAVLAALLSVGCADRPRSEHPLASAFPSVGASVIQGKGFTRTAEGFVLAEPGRPADPLAAAEAALARRARLQLTLPASGAQAATVRLPGGHALHVRELGAAGEARLEGAAVAYAREGGTSYWTATEEGFEEWIDVADAGEAPVAQWELAGATPEQDGDDVLLRAPGGESAARVRAPFAVTASGARARAWLRASGQIISLYTEARGRALVDPAWGTAGSMQTRFQHTATLLLNGKVLVVGGRTAAGAGALRSAVELFDPATGTWSTTGSLAAARYYHTATLLLNGKVLVVGGDTSGGPGNAIVASAELYDPASGTWTSAGSSTTARFRHTATLLANGDVLVAGGLDASATTAVSSADLFTPGGASGTWASTGSMAQARSWHTATRLTDGKVVVIGGGATGTAEVYDPTLGTWTAKNALITNRSTHTATLMTNGNVLIAGGTATTGGASLKSSEIYAPGPGAFSAGGNMSAERASASATLLPNGQVLVVGGNGLCCSTFPASSDLFDPGSGWAVTPLPTTPRSYHTATLLPSGKLLLVGGASNSTLNTTAELLDPGTPGWAPSPPSLNGVRLSHTATLLPNGFVLVAGGANAGAALATAELYNPVTGNWAFTAAMAIARAEHTATLLPNGRVLVAGGRSGASLNTVTSTSEVYDPATATWSSGGSLTTARASHAASLLANGQVLVSGGITTTGGAPVASAELFNPVTGSWSATSAMAGARSAHTSTRLANGWVLVAGGQSPIGTALATSELYDATAGTWSGTTTGLATGRFWHTATLLPSGRVLAVSGAMGPSAATPSAELYDPTSGAKGSWSSAGSVPPSGRVQHTATLLPNGGVLVLGGRFPPGNAPVSSVELYDPALSPGAWSALPSPPVPRWGHTATLLNNGNVLVAAGQGGASTINFVDLYSDSPPSAAMTPILSSVPTLTAPSASFTLGGSYFTGISEGGAGGTQNSATNFPFVQLQALGEERRLSLVPTTFSASSVTVPGVAAGIYQARVVVSGTPSAPKLLPVFPALTLSPATLSLPPKGTQAFTAGGSAGSGYAFSLAQNQSGGSVATVTGSYTAGSTGSVTDIVQVADAYGNTTSTTVTVGPGVSVTPGSASVPPKGGQSFSAAGGSGTGYSWVVLTNNSGGATVSGAGAYVAGATGSVTDTLRVTDSLGNGATVNVTVTAAASISPLTPSVAPRGSRLFTASGGSGTGYTWSLPTNNSGGSINPTSGAYTAGPTPSTTDTVRVTDSLGNVASTVVTVTAGVSISPAAPTLPPRQSQTFTASGGSGTGFTWAMVTSNSGGSIGAASGIYTAGSTGSVSDVIQVTDSLGNTAQATITVGPTVSLSPASATLAPKGTQTFTASGGSGTGFTWAMVSAPSGGSIGAGSGAYTAGATGSSTDVIRVTDSLGNTTTASITVTAGVSISPASASVTPKGTQSFSASGGSGSGYVWTVLTNNSLTATISGAGLYTAGTKGSVTDVVRVTDSLGNVATVNVTVTAGVGISPQSASTPPLGNVAFSASGGTGTGFAWSITVNNSSGATINPTTGAYKAGTVQAVDTVQVVDSLGNVATAQVTVTNALAVTPSAVSVAPKQTQVFAASGGSGAGIVWTLLTNNSGATFDAATATYTAGATGGVADQVRATDSLGATATATITVTAGVSIAPASASVTPLGARTFVASGGSNAGFVWSLATNASGGSIGAATGAYVAGTTGAVTDVVQVVDSLGNVRTANVTVSAGVSVTPPTATVPPLGSQTFAASGGTGVGFTYSLSPKPSGGSIDPFTGQYQAGTKGDVTDTVIARDSLGNQSTVAVTVTAGVTITPATPTVVPKGTLGLTASGGSGTGYTWAFVTNLSQGTLNATSGAYVAGATGNVTDVVRATDSLGNVGTVSISVSGNLAVSPPLANIPPKGTLQLSPVGGSAPYVWTLPTNGSGGSVDANGLYTAGATPSVTDSVRVTDALGNFATATITVTQGLSLSPSAATVPPSGTQQFTASGGSGTGFTWELSPNASGGVISAEGAYIAGEKAGVSDTVKVTDSLGNVASAQVSVVTGAPGETATIPFSQRPPVSGWSCGCNSGPSSGQAMLGLVGLLALARSRRRRRAAAGALVAVALVAAVPALAAKGRAAPAKSAPVKSAPAKAPTKLEMPPPPVFKAPPPPPAAPAAPAAPRPAEKRTMAVLDVEITAVNEKLDGSAFTEMLTSAVDGTGMFKVVSSKDLSTMMGLERQRQMMGCSEDSSCMAELANALGAELVLVATVGRVGENYLVTVKLIDAKRSKTVSRGGAQSKDPNLLLNAMWNVAQETLDGYGRSLPPEEAQRWAARPKPEPPAGLVAAQEGTPSSFGLAAGVVGAFQVLSEPGKRGSIGAEVDVTWRRGRLDLGAGIIIGPNLGARVYGAFALIDSRFRLDLGLRGAAYPGLGLYGGGPVAVAEFALTPLFAVTATGGAEIFPAPGTPVLALLGTVGAAVHF